MAHATVLRDDQAVVQSFDWGDLTWRASAALGNSNQLTVGTCVLKAGFTNTRHVHADCDEILVVGKGSIAHTVSEGEEAILGPGDTISIPAGLPHSARNVGDEDAILTIIYPTGERSFAPV
jgi:quercetin dioxygenase-like cupin family protein